MNPTSLPEDDRNNHQQETPPQATVVMPWAWHGQLLERHLEMEHGAMTLGRLGISTRADGGVDWLVRELLPDLSAMAGPSIRGRNIAFFRSDGRDLVPWVESHLPKLPESVQVEVIHGMGPYLGSAWGFYRGPNGARILPLDELHLPGLGMRSVPLRNRPHEKEVETSAAEETSRTAGAFGLHGPEILGSLRHHGIALYGASRNGLFIAEWAVRLGIPMRLCDPKPLKKAHLGEISLLLGEEDVGRAKCEAFARRVDEWAIASAPVAPVVALASSKEGYKAAKGAGVLVDACDRDSGRLACALYATTLHKPQLSIATGVRYNEAGLRTLGADVRLTLPGDRCLLCLGGLEDYPRALRELASRNLANERNDDAWRNERAGSLRSLNSAATGVALRLLEDLFAGRIGESRWVRLEWDEDGRLATREPEPGLQKASCPLCRKAGEGDGAYI